VCIALTCRDGNEQRIVACVDSRVDEVHFSSDKAVKFKALGHSWFALLSGEWAAATELAGLLRAGVLKENAPVSREDAFSRIAKLTRDFTVSPFFYSGCNAELIVGGFVESEALLLRSTYVNGDPQTELAGDMAVVGSGFALAQGLLRVRGYSAGTSLQRAIYLAYEAKKYSENSPGVGPKTGILVVYPNGTGKSFGPRYYLFLEESRKLFGLQSIDPAALPNPEYPRDGLSRQAPSQGSPGRPEEP